MSLNTIVLFAAVTVVVAFVGFANYAQQERKINEVKAVHDVLVEFKSRLSKIRLPAVQNQE